jgi:hypothetical protein
MWRSIKCDVAAAANPKKYHDHDDVHMHNAQPGRFVNPLANKNIRVISARSSDQN